MSAEFKYKLSAMVIIYLIILSGFIFHFKVIPTNTNLDSARYMLSTLVQSEATIIALAITLSLVAVQLAASSYSARLIDIFKESTKFWIIIIFYLLTITYQLGVLKLIEPANSINVTNSLPNVISNLQAHISVSYILSIAALTALIYHIWVTFDLIKPKTIIDKLAKNMTPENITITSIPGSEKDATGPIVSIVVKSLEIHDEDTVIYGLNKIGGCVTNTLNLANLCDAQRARITEFIAYNFLLIGVLTIDGEDIYAASNLIVALKPIGYKSVDKEFTEIAIKTVDVIAQIGEKSIEHNLGVVAENASNAINDIGRKAAERGNQLDNIAQFIVGSNKKIAIKAIRNELKSESFHINENLGAIGLTFARNSFDVASTTALGSLEEIVSECAIKREKDIAIHAITYIQNIGAQASRNRLYGAVRQAARSSQTIVENAVKHGFLEVIGRLVDAIKSIGKEFVVDLEPSPDEIDIYTDVACEIITILEKIIRVLGEQKGFDKQREFIHQLVDAIGQYGKSLAGKGIARGASTASAALGRLNYIGILSLMDPDTIKNNLISILEISNDADTCVIIAKGLNDLNHLDDAESASKKAISIEGSCAKAYYQLYETRNAQAFLLTPISSPNAERMKAAAEKKKAADDALAKYNALKDLEDKS